MITEGAYQELIQNCVAYNSRLCAERRLRLPFLDSHTGIAQNPSELWRSSADRQVGKDLSISYPAKRWKKKRHVISMAPPDVRLFRPAEMANFAEPIETVLAPNMFERSVGERSITKNLRGTTQEVAASTVVKLEQTDSRDAADKDSKDTWYDEVSESEPPEKDDYDELDDEDDYEETYVKKRKKRKQAKAAGKRIAAVAAEENDKLFVCDLCNAKYKTKPGLTYHVQHVHEMQAEQPPQSNGNQSTKSERVADGTPVPRGEGPYCDFCLGNVSVNLKTNRPEELVSCSDCGRAGHPSCLSFTQNQVVSTGKYGWQCIECKSCAICGTSENDDQLLFCDDCDRGYHMYCLQPPLVEPPEGSWSCDLCRNEFGPAASNPNAPHPPKEKNFPRNLVAKRNNSDN